VSRLQATRLRTKLRLLLACTSVLLLVPVVAATLHLGRVMDLSRRLSRLESAELRASPAERPPLLRQLQELRQRMDGLGDRAFRDVVTLAALSLVVLVALTLVAPARLLAPLSRLAHLIRQTEGGNLRVVRGQVDGDEIGELTGRLHHALQELERFDELKRRKIAALAAQRSQLLELLPAPAVLVDAEGRLLAASASFRRLFTPGGEAELDQPLLQVLGGQKTGLAPLLASRETVEAALELAGQRTRVEVRPGAGEAPHRLALFHLADGQGPPARGG